MEKIEAKIAELVGPLLAELPRPQRPAIIALAERIAAERYRAWAGQLADRDAAAALRTCAEREEEIAARVEAVVPGAAAIQSTARSSHPHVAEGYAALFAGHSLPEQFALQARAERVGAATWRTLAESSDAALREVFLACARLEEASAEVLEELVAQGIEAAS